MRVNKLNVVALILVLSLALSACGKGSGGATQAGSAQNDGSASEQTKEYKDTLNVAVTAQPPTLDSASTVSAVTFDIAGNIFEQLYTLNAQYEPVPQLAESVEKSDDGLTYTFPLRKGVTFHNGKEMVADDVVASMNRWLETSSRAKSLLAGAKFEKIDDYAVKLTVEKATSDVLTLLASHAQFPAIMPKEVIDGVTADGLKEYIGTGPYQFKEWKQDQYIQLVKYDGYKGLDSEASGYFGKKEAPAQNLFFYFVSDPATRIAGIQTGKYDVAASIPTENYDEFAADSNIQLHTYAGGALTAFLNTSEGLLKNEKLRQAILAALNDDEILLASYAKPELYTLSPGYMNLKQPQWSTDAGKEYYNQNNPEKAKQLLREAGYNGEEITLLTTKDYAEMYTATLVIQDQLKKAGFNVKVDNYDFPTFLETKNDLSKWDLFVASTGYQLTPPQMLVVTPDWAGLDHDTVKNGIVALRGAATPEDAKQEWEKIQTFLYEYGAATVLGHYNSVIATTKNVEGFAVQDSFIIWNAKASQ
ncbi:ABC transporter substrate-binding protein [Paenibacillus macerans]|uniref:ABC transporter substrate-binding protein n=1 Tax=Paenibacillus macerans TaxID=44252 RepID=A0A6N8EZ41_PAEMA|nr:ABC transporter substrate-binding protein [Paenibacillus macerans]MDU5945589.1 ABC transporter substrate-binding protein [Paenibacillus macerans]MED4954299.1 ABC transporter substrate-binding protein [Paenibacillus macerans]MUG25437.1 ABC transporter substrate-binding protein [Paenibacillus macerans]UMV50644.1 ABC transporter substrate-binding protein [Paenibacillus macerans]